MRRDPGQLRSVLMYQVVYLLMLGFMDMTVRNMPAIVVDQDQTAESRDMVQKLEKTGTLKILSSTTSVEEARDQIRAGRARAAIVIPPHFHRDREAGKEAQVLALVDGTDAMASAQAVGAIDGVAGRMNLESHREAPSGRGAVVSRSLLLFNPEGRNADFVLPGLLAFIISVGFTIMMTVASSRSESWGRSIDFS